MHKKLRQLQQQKSDLVAQANAILSKDTVTDEDLTTAKAKQAEAEKVNAQIEAVQAQIDAEASMAAVTVVEADEQAATSGNPASVKKRFASFGEQLQSITIAYQSKGKDVDPRLLDIEEDHRQIQSAAAGGQAAIGSDGGYLIQSDFSQEIIKQSYDTGAITSRCRRAKLGANSDKLVIPYINETSRVTGSRFGGVQVYWANEADTATAKKPKIGKMEIPAHKLLGICYLTRELLTDAPAIDSIYRTAFSEEIMFMTEDAILNGTGAGQPLGLLKSPALVTVDKEVGQDTATLLTENINNMYSRLNARNRQNAVWLHNQDIEPQLFGMTQVIGTGGVPVFLPPNGLASSPNGTLLGRPLVPNEYNATLGTVGDLALADLSQYMLVEKGELRVDMSEHVNFASDEIAIRFVVRVGGQPLWQSAVTPAKGTKTKSAFVTLATR